MNRLFEWRREIENLHTKVWWLDFQQQKCDENKQRKAFEQKIWFFLRFFFNKHSVGIYKNYIVTFQFEEFIFYFFILFSLSLIVTKMNEREKKLFSIIFSISILIGCLTQFNHFLVTFINFLVVVGNVQEKNACFLQCRHTKRTRACSSHPLVCSIHWFTFYDFYEFNEINLN